MHIRRQVAATQIPWCVLENFCENLCRCNRILSPQQVGQIQSDLSFCDLLQRQNSVAETKIFRKILYLSTHEAICRCDVSPHCVSATNRPTCTHGVICRRDWLLQLVAQCIPTFLISEEPGQRNRDIYLERTFTFEEEKGQTKCEENTVLVLTLSLSRQSVAKTIKL